MQDYRPSPDYIFESSWEVCNKVGGIYTVLSTRANTLQQNHKDSIIYIGPDIWGDQKIEDFIEDKKLFSEWKLYAEATNLKVKIGRWNVHGKPPVILVDFKNFFEERDNLFYRMWEDFHVNSINAYGDYEESCIFAYAVGKVIESFYNYYHLEKKNVVAHFNEWMLGMGALYVQKELPKIGTLFTTHATSIGRSIAGNNKELYAYLEGYNGDQMAVELNMEAKHSLEKQTAKNVDCFTTVSDITAIECEQLLDKAPDIVTPNGFEKGFVPVGATYTKKRKQAREKLINIAEKLTGSTISKDALLISTSGRYEYRNKGIDVFINSVNKLRSTTNRETIAFIMVPAWVKEARGDLKKAIQEDYQSEEPMQCPLITHWLHNMNEDKVLNYARNLQIENRDNLKLVFIPCYLNGNDGILNESYYNLLIGMDVTIYPSYYEPWGYTPLESIAFGIPTITTNLAGFGLWAQNKISGNDILEGVAVIERNDSNFEEVAEAIKEQLLKCSILEKKQMSTLKAKCKKLARKAEWSQFNEYYEDAYRKALRKAESRKL